MKLLITIFSFIAISCNQGKVDNDKNIGTLKNEVHNTSSKTLSQNNKFRIWLRDTLLTLNLNWINNVGNGVIKKEYTVNSDSSLLSINIYYDSIIGISKKNQKVDSILITVLSLLKEYKEYPKGGFRLKFIWVLQFYPSPIVRLTKETYDQIDDLEVIESNKKLISRYGFIRGRLSGKEIINSGNNNEIIKDIDFIWEGDSLIKRSN